MTRDCEPGHHSWEKDRRDDKGGWWYRCKVCGKVEWEP